MSSIEQEKFCKGCTNKISLSNNDNKLIEKHNKITNKECCEEIKETGYCECIDDIQFHLQLLYYCQKCREERIDNAHWEAIAYLEDGTDIYLNW